MNSSVFSLATFGAQPERLKNGLLPRLFQTEVAAAEKAKGSFTSDVAPRGAVVDVSDLNASTCGTATQRIVSVSLRSGRLRIYTIGRDKNILQRTLNS